MSHYGWPVFILIIRVSVLGRNVLASQRVFIPLTCLEWPQWQICLQVSNWYKRYPGKISSLGLLVQVIAVILQHNGITPSLSSLAFERRICWDLLSSVSGGEFLLSYSAVIQKMISFTQLSLVPRNMSNVLSIWKSASLVSHLLSTLHKISPAGNLMMNCVNLSIFLYKYIFYDKNYKKKYCTPTRSTSYLSSYRRVSRMKECLYSAFRLIFK